MKNVSLIALIFFTQLSWSQVGIGTTTPDPSTMLDVQGKVKIVDGTQGENKTLVSDANGKAEWSNVNDGIKTRRINNSGGGTTTTNILLWSHPSGIKVYFDASTNKVSVVNNTGDADTTHYWDVSIQGGGESDNLIKQPDYNFKYINNGDTANLDLDSGSIDRGWFEIIASDRNNMNNGFVLHIIYFEDNFNGMVQYWVN